MNRTISFALVLLLAALTTAGACSSSKTTPADGAAGSGDGGQSGFGGQAGASGDGGAGGNGGTGGSHAGGGGAAGQTGAGGGGAGGQMAGSNCPGAPPAAGGGCTGTGTCYYQDCAHAGRTVASCSGGTWSVQSAACGNFACFPGSGRMCTGDQICSESAGGALLVECISNTCGTGPLSCDCLPSCAGSCAISGSVQGGFQINCNTCPSNQCA